MKDRWNPLEGMSDVQHRMLAEYEQLLRQATRKRNLISRASADDIRGRHIAHSLTIAMRNFPDGASVVDWGTGGGLPGIPLAIRFPMVTFHLVDSIFKKTWTLERFRDELGLDNVIVHRMRAEDWSEPIDYAVSRATAPLVTLWSWTERNVSASVPRGKGDWSPGLIALKGGDLAEEIAGLRQAYGDLAVEEISLHDLTGLPAMKEKWLIGVRRRPSTV